MLQEFVNFGCFAITALWLALLAWWPQWMSAAAVALLLAFGLASRRHRTGLALAAAGAFVTLGAALCALCWLSSEQMLSLLPMNARPFAQLLVVPLPLVALFLAVSLMQALLREPRAIDARQALTPPPC